MITELIRKSLKTRNIQREAVKRRREYVKSWIEEYRKAGDYIRQNCTYREGIMREGGDFYSDIIVLGTDKTNKGLGALSESDVRSNEDLVSWLDNEDKWNELAYKHKLSWGSERYVMVDDEELVDTHLSKRLTEAVLAVRLSHDKTLQNYLLEGGILGRTFVDYTNPRSAYIVEGISPCRIEINPYVKNIDNMGLIMNISGSKKEEHITKHLHDRELKS